MAEKWPYQYKESTTTPLEIDLDADEGLEVKNIFVYGGANDELVRVTIDRALNYGLMVAPVRRNHVPFYDEGQDLPGLFDQIRQMGHPAPAPKVTGGGKLVLDTDTDPSLIAVEYTVLEGDQIPAIDAPGAAQANEWLYISYGTNSVAASTDDQWVALDQSLMPVELDDFPFESNPRSPHHMQPLAIGIDCAVTGSTRIDHTRIKYNNVEQTTEDATGIITDVDTENLLPFGGQADDRPLTDLSWLPTLNEEDEIIIECQVNYDGTNALAAGDVKAVFVAHVTPAGG